MDPPANGPTLRQYFSMLYRRKMTVLAVFVITSGAVATGVYLRPPVFTASASLIVKFGREFIYRPEVGGPESSKTFSLDEMVSAQVEILRSRDLAQQVVEELGVGRLYPELLEEPDPDTVRWRAVAKFQDRAAVTSVFDSSIIRISFEHSDPETAAEALNLLVEKFKDKHLEIFGESKSDFLAAQLEKYRQQLAEAEAALESFKRENGIYQLPAQKDAIVRQRVDLQAALRDTGFRMAELEQQLKAFHSDAGDPVEAVSNPVFSRQSTALISRRSELNTLLQDADSRIAELTQNLARFKDRRRKTVPAQPGVEQFRSLDEAHSRLLDLELKYLELRRNYNKDSREITALRSEILLVRKFLKERGEYVGKVLETGIRDELSSLRARRKALADQISEIDSELQSLALLERSLQTRTISTELAALESKKGALVAEIAKLDENARALSTKEKVLRQLERRVTLGEASFRTYLEKSEEAKTTEKLDEQKIVNIRVVEKAVPPVAPSGLPRRIQIALGAVAGLLAGVAAAFFLELLRP